VWTDEHDETMGAVRDYAITPKKTHKYGTLCYVDRASLYNFVNRTNFVHKFS